ncbi:hypothetical protein M3181_05455 [Mesobacillus maritimus]|uniref:hypothetical protein n=1 Tax=Mesobacillus maritimus TaxID=1643336 RepID=UPI00203F29A0|nr:hypothetical protein [Mesobacillus maritimus]MCM3668448.1 hypothetical protein [Mesobacillus maritimus]
MEPKILQELFDESGWSTIYEKYQYKLWLTGIDDELSEEMLRAYFDAYSYEDAEAICFDELLIQLKTFKYIYEKNDLKLYPW